MKPSPALNLSAKVLLSLILVLACPLLLPAQSKDKKTPAPPPPPQQQQQQPQRQQPQPQQQPQQQQRPVQQQQRPVQQQQRAGPQGTAPTPVKPGTGPTPVKPGTGPATVRPGTGPTAVKPGTGPATVKPGIGAATVKPGTGPTTVKPVAPVKTETLAGGGTRTRLSNGAVIVRDKTNHVSSVTTSHGAVATLDLQGRVKTIQAQGMTINRAPNGQRQIVTAHLDANRRPEKIVSTGSNRGYVERRFERGGHEYVRRTYVYENRTYVTVYRTYYYGGAPYYYYVPAYYYAPLYYGWAYNPWPAPVYYTWGWYGDPWYAPYGYYFAPYPVYPSAAFWLTDYLIAENLQAAYQAQADANANAAAANADAAAANANAAAANADEAAAQRGSQASAVTLTPEVKDMIAEEVKAQLAAEQAAATQNGTASGTPTSATAQPAGNTEQAPPALDPNLRVFIVTTSLDVTASGQACTLNPGDVLLRTEDTPKDNTVTVNVVSRQKSDCPSGSSPRIQVADLQEMHNRFREQLDNGLKTLADNQGKKGIPSGPAPRGRENPDGTAVPDLTATKNLQDQRREADQAEKEVQQATSSTGSAGGNN